MFTQLNDQTVLFQTIQFSISYLFAFSLNVKQNYLTHRSGAATSGQNLPGSYGIKGVLRIPQSSSISGASQSDCLISYSGHSFVGSYPSAEMQSVYSAPQQPTGSGEGDSLVIVQEIKS